MLPEFEKTADWENKLKYPIGGYAPGKYWCTCANCEQKFMGDKYARQCKPCAINAVNESNTKAIQQLGMLKKALTEMSSSKDVIDKFIRQKD